MSIPQPVLEIEDSLSNPSEMRVVYSESVVAETVTLHDEKTGAQVLLYSSQIDHELDAETMHKRLDDFASRLHHTLVNFENGEIEQLQEASQAALSWLQKLTPHINAPVERSPKYPVEKPQKYREVVQQIKSALNSGGDANA